MEEKHIVELFQSGRKEKAFQKLYKIYPKFKSYVLKQGGDKEQAEDLFQEAIVVLYKKINSKEFQFTGSIATYLFNTAKYLWWDLNKAQGAVVLDANLSSNDQEELELAVEQERRLQKMEVIVLSLGDKCRQILEAFYYQGKRMSEIAEQFKYASEKSAKNQKYKCLERARKAITNV